MSERAQQLAQQFTLTNEALLTTLANASDAQLAALCPAEHWPVLVTARHVAVSYRVVGSWVRKVAAGQEVPITRAQIDAGNAQLATEPTPTRDEVLELLRANAAKTAELIRGLTDEQLAASAAVNPSEGRVLTADQVVRYVLIHHVQEHLTGIQAAINSLPA
jgi:hypothetical protein